MIFSLTLKDKMEPLTYEAIDDNFVFSVINSLIVNQDDTTPSGIDEHGDLQLEIRDYNGQDMSIENKAIFYKLYAAIKQNMGNIDDLSLLNSESKNLLYSTNMFGYNIVNAGFQDFSLSKNSEMHNGANFIFLNITLSPNIIIEEV